MPEVSYHETLTLEPARFAGNQPVMPLSLDHAGDLR